MRYLAIIAAAATLVLSGCATTLRSDVTSFNAWPATLADKSYAFQAPAPAEDTLEYRTYQAMVGTELNKLGFQQAADGSQPQLLVGMHFRTVIIPVKTYIGDPFYGPGFYGPGFGRYSLYRSSFYRPSFYDPFFYPNRVDEIVRNQFERQLNVTINTSSGTKLYDVTVHNSSRVRSTPRAMPALVQSAFAGFPGQSGVARQVDVEIPDQEPAILKAGAPAPAVK